MQILFFLKCLILSDINLPISIITFLVVLPFFQLPKQILNRHGPLMARASDFDPISTAKQNA